MSDRVFIAILAALVLVLCVVAADTVIVVRNREYIDSSQKASDATATSNLLATCERFKALRADDNVSHYTDWIVDHRFLQFVKDLSTVVSTSAARKLDQDNLIATLTDAIADKAWVPGTVCTGKLTVASLASPAAIPFDKQLPSASALEP